VTTAQAARVDGVRCHADERRAGSSGDGNRGLCALAVATSADGANNLLVNPRSSGRGRARGLADRRLGRREAQRDTTVAHSGQASGRIEISPRAWRSTRLQALPAWRHAGEATSGTVFARTRGMTDQGAYVAVEYFAGDRRLSVDHGGHTGPGDHEWMRWRWTASCPERIAQPLPGGTRQGQAWFDDATLARTLSAPAQFAGDQVTRTSPGVTVNARFLGFGSQGDYFLTCGFNTMRGVNDDDRRLVLDRVARMRPQIIRTFFTTVGGSRRRAAHAGQRGDARLHRLGAFPEGPGHLGDPVPWGDYFASPAWMRCGSGRLPAPEERRR